MDDTWLQRWREGRIGFHEDGGSELLRRHWPRQSPGSRVLVPLCGKSVDLLWLASQGLQVVGVELSELAVRAFFDENGLEFDTLRAGRLLEFRALSVPITVVCGDYFAFTCPPCDAVFDRGALVAVQPTERERYIAHTRTLLTATASVLLITLSYDQGAVDGPPFSVDDAAAKKYWPDLRRVLARDDLETASPKFRKAGLSEVIESVWVSG